MPRPLTTFSEAMDALIILAPLLPLAAKSVALIDTGERWALQIGCSTGPKTDRLLRHLNAIAYPDESVETRHYRIERYSAVCGRVLVGVTVEEHLVRRVSGQVPGQMEFGTV